MIWIFGDGDRVSLFLQKFQDPAIISEKKEKDNEYVS